MPLAATNAGKLPFRSRRNEFLQNWKTYSITDRRLCSLPKFSDLLHQTQFGDGFILSGFWPWHYLTLVSHAATLNCVRVPLTVDTLIPKSDFRGYVNTN